MTLRNKRRERPTQIDNLPRELLERVLEHAVGTRTPAGGLRERQWVSAGDLMRAQPLALVCRKWRDALRNIVTRFTFFALPSTARGPSAKLLRPLMHLPNLHALQLDLRPPEASMFARELYNFLGRDNCRVRTVHLCMPPDPRSSAVAAVAEAVAAGASTRLDVLSLDSCGLLADDVVAEVARHAPNLTTLALDCTTMKDWAALAKFRNLTELSLRNFSFDDQGLDAVVNATPNLQTLALGYTGAGLTAVGLASLARLKWLRSVELARCAGVRDDGVLVLADISSLTTVYLYFDVSADALVRLTLAMGARLRALCVTSVRTPGGDGAAAVGLVTQAARRNCPNLGRLDFAQRRRPHWSERPYAEAIRFLPAAPIGPHSPNAAQTVKAGRRRQPRFMRFLKELWFTRRTRNRFQG